METVSIKPGYLTLADLRTVYHKPVKVTLEGDHDRMRDSLAFIKRIVEEKLPTYGVNTGIGLLASTPIDCHDLETLQHSIVLSHAVGVGHPVNDGLVRLIMVLKINSLAQGYSGIRPEILQALISLINSEIYPHIPVKGSVGASGDLAPLSHMASVLLGEGKARFKGEWLPAVEALSLAGLEPLKLCPREGVSLINGTQVSTAFALRGLFDAEDLYASALICGSLTIEATLGSRKPFDARIHTARGHKGQIETSAAFRYLLEECSEISEFHSNCSKIQDPYSLRCQPQVMGACLTQIRHAANILLTESNGVTDNPLIFVEEREVISAGNFHAEPIAFAADNLALVFAEIGSLSERRTSLLMDKHMSQLPAFLVHNGGVNTGFMTAQVTAAALTSENKSLAYPASVDSIPTSANQEDHVSMAPAAGKRLWEMAVNVQNILAVEWLCAVQGLDLRGMKTSAVLEKARNILRSHVRFLDKDRFMAPDINAASDLIGAGALSQLVPHGLLPSLGVKKRQVMEPELI